MTRRRGNVDAPKLLKCKFRRLGTNPLISRGSGQSGGSSYPLSNELPSFMYSTEDSKSYRGVWLPFMIPLYSLLSAAGFFNILLFSDFSFLDQALEQRQRTLSDE